MPASPEGTRERSRRDRRSSYSDDEGRERKSYRDMSHSSDEGYSRRRRTGDDRDGSHRRRRDRSREDSYRRRDRDDEHSHRRRRSRDRSQQRRRSRSPDAKRRKRSPSVSRSRSPPARKSRGPLPSQNDQFRGEVAPQAAGDQPVKEKPNFKPTGLLAKEANTVAGTSTVLKYHEPAEARKPPAKEQWRMYVFRKKDLVDTVQLYQRSCWLMGRDQTVTDLKLEHPSISKQHAVIQFRFQTTTNEYGDKTNKVKPYLIDLESANGTKLNGKAIGTSRYVQLVDGDVISFGDSEREYVMMLPPP